MTSFLGAVIEKNNMQGRYMLPFNVLISVNLAYLFVPTNASLDCKVFIWRKVSAIALSLSSSHMINRASSV